MLHKSFLFALLTPAALLVMSSPAQQHGGMSGMMHGRMMGTLPETITSDSNPVTDAKIRLGRMLFYDVRLSKNRDVSCNSCHSLQAYGVDGKPVSSGHNGQLGARNSPSVYHAAGQIAQFWDGRAADVEEQAKGPILNPVEMAMSSEAEVVASLQSIQGYRAAFKDAFPDDAEPVTFDNLARAIGAFERKLVTPSRWDRFLNGDRNALSQQEMAGHHEFMHSGCASCHNGPYVGGRVFEKLGVRKAWPNAADLGRMSVTQDPADRLVFKVPVLRNVEKTSPYFHDGKVATLDEAIRLMGEYQLGIQLDEPQVAQIAAWLKSLTGEIPSEYIRPPALPQ